MKKILFAVFFISAIYWISPSNQFNVVSAAAPVLASHVHLAGQK